MWSFFSRDPTKDLPYEIKEPVSNTGPNLDQICPWKLHEGKKKPSGESVTVWIYEIQPGREREVELVKASIKRLKTLRHPCVLTYLDSLETDKCVYLVTEEIIPLQAYLKDLQSSAQKELTLSWGIYQVTKCLSFLNNDASLLHCNLHSGSVFVTMGGEWKLGGLEYMIPGSDYKNSAPSKFLHALQKYDPPEKLDLSKTRSITKWSGDIWTLGILIWEVFNGLLPKMNALKDPGKIPKPLVPIYCELVSANPSSRPNPADVLDRSRRVGGYFRNELIDTVVFLEEITIKDSNEIAQFFSKLTSMLDTFPKDISKNKVLPHLLNAFEFGNAGSAVLAPLLKLGSHLDTAEYQLKIIPCIE